MSNSCPRCHAGHFVAGRIESSAPVTVTLADGEPRRLEAFVCTNCGLTLLRAARPAVPPAAPDTPPDVQEYDF